MAYSRIRIDLTKSDFPFLTTLTGRTILAAGAEESKPGHAETNTVGMLYCENVLPTKEGIQSVDYFEIVPALDIPDGSYLTLLPFRYSELTGTYNSLANYSLAKPYSQWGLRFQRVLEVRSSNSLRAYIGITQIGQLFIVTEAVPTWVQINNEGWGPVDEDISNVSVATLLVNGTTETYICLPRHGVFRVNVSTRTLTRVSFRAGSNIVQTNVKGICASYNYLVMHDGNQLQWSSAFDPLDFNLATAQETGTGFGTPIGLQGTIVALISNPSGYTVYSDVNAINVEYSANTLFPWVFTPIANSAGIKTARDVVVGQDNNNYAMTTQGLQLLNQRNAVPVFPEFTDFLAADIVETYDFITNKVTAVSSAGQGLDYDIGYLGSRWVILSYGLKNGTYREYTHAFVYDTALKRWGKLVVNHVDCTDYRIGQFNEIKRGLGLLQMDGTIVGIDTQATFCPCSVDSLNQLNYVISPCFPGVWTGANADEVSTSGTILVVNSPGLILNLPADNIPPGDFIGSYTEVHVELTTNVSVNSTVTVAITTPLGSYSKSIDYSENVIGKDIVVKFQDLPVTDANGTPLGVSVSITNLDTELMPTANLLLRSIIIVGSCDIAD